MNTTASTASQQPADEPRTALNILVDMEDPMNTIDGLAQAIVMMAEVLPSPQADAFDVVGRTICRLVNELADERVAAADLLYSGPDPF
ncbi:MAG: hypothetical protein HC909_03150 [Blastochloris sp.]|nr:hypothetical protein [Blastochloris sp.]